ncbi:MAG: hypothetical protein AVDCRST_MAG68-3520, partial [uncultured Gemmatimonadetes bacterium]
EDPDSPAALAGRRPRLRGGRRDGAGHLAGHARDAGQLRARMPGRPGGHHDHARGHPVHAAPRAVRAGKARGGGGRGPRHLRMAGPRDPLQRALHPLLRARGGRDVRDGGRARSRLDKSPGACESQARDLLGGRRAAGRRRHPHQQHGGPALPRVQHLPLRSPLPHGDPRWNL